MGGSEDPFEAAQTQAVGGCESSGGRARQVVVDNGENQRASLSRSVRLHAYLAADRRFRSLLQGSLLDTRCRSEACTECE
jgi:hypothetical protein